MERPTTRVLAVLQILQAQGRISGPELAARIGVDGRTLRRYITILEALGIPIASERGRHGGYRLVAGFKLPPMMFTDEEAVALSIGLIAARGLGLADAAPAVASAQAKLERVMPPNIKRRVRAIDETVKLELGRPSLIAGDGASLAVLSSAAQARQRTHLRYRSAREVSTREFDPYGLAWRGGRWYVVGRCHLRQSLRTFRLDRIEAVHTLPESFGRPDDFDALAYLAFSVATLPRLHAIEVLLETDLDRARREVFASLGILEAVEGGVCLLAQADDLDWFARELSRLPFPFQIRHPESLRAALQNCAARLQRIVDAPRAIEQG